MKNIIYKMFRKIFNITKKSIESCYSICIQNNYDLKELNAAKKIILFLIPIDKINGGIMSIFSLCNVSRELNPDAVTMISTFPHNFTYFCNKMFKNNEKIYRFQQIVNNAKNIDEMIIHIPELYTSGFYKSLNPKDIKFLKSIKNLHINIMNQNIELMPEPEEIQDLYKLTSNITQTTAHIRYNTQEVCNKWKIPTHLFSFYLDFSLYSAVPFEKKEKIIVLSPDINTFRKNIIKELKKKLKGWKIITVKNMTFTQYMELIAKAYFVITFGEGMDGYFTQPPRVQTLSLAVYNKEFFPNESWRDLDNVYESYEQMQELIANDLKQYASNKDLYYSAIEKHFTKYKFSRKTMMREQYVDNIKRFYDKQYDLLPTI